MFNYNVSLKFCLTVISEERSTFFVEKLGASDMSRAPRSQTVVIRSLRYCPNRRRKPAAKPRRGRTNGRIGPVRLCTPKRTSLFSFRRIFNCKHRNTLQTIANETPYNRRRSSKSPDFTANWTNSVTTATMSNFPRAQRK